MQANKELLNNLKVVAKKAGREILKYYQNEKLQSVSIKNDQTPVTKADLEASLIIEKELREIYPDIPLLSEESDLDTFHERLKWDRYFLVDPLDGTKEFIKGSDEFTVNIALIEKSESIAGVIYQPVKDICYYGNLQESYRETAKEISRLPIVEYQERKIRIVSSKSHKNVLTDKYIENLRSSFQVESLVFGSSLKICKVAEGVADLNPRLGGTSEWDIAAGHAIIRGAGGDIVKLGTQERINYNKLDLANPHYEVRRRELLGLALFK